MTKDRAAAAIVCGLAPGLGASSGAAAEPSLAWQTDGLQQPQPEGKVEQLLDQGSRGHTWLEHQRLAVFPMMSAGQLLTCRIA